MNPHAYHELSRVHLFLAGDSWTPPALANGLLYVCQNKRDAIHGTPPRLLCYDLRALPPTLTIESWPPSATTGRRYSFNGP